MIRRLFSAAILAALALIAAPAAAQSPFGDVAPVADEDLAEARGGFVLPNGWNIGLVIRQDTSVAGELVLRTTYVLEEQGPRISIDEVGAGLSVTQTNGDQGRNRVSIAMPGTDVSHLMGRNNGSIIANTADNRIIDTSTVIDIDLSDLPVGSVGSLLPSLDNLATQTAGFTID